MNMLKKFKFLHFLFLIFNALCITCQSQNTSTIFCGKIPIQPPFLSPSPNLSSPLNHMISCKSKKLYFRTSLGLFIVSSVNYTAKTLTISHSSSSNFVSPSLLSAGFPPPPSPNSLLLFNCSIKNHPVASYASNCSHLNSLYSRFSESSQKLTGLIKTLERSSYSCLLVNDIEKLDKRFDPKDLRCTHYSPVHRISSNGDEFVGYKLGTRISFDLPDHVPDICNECEKSNGNCGVGLRCICHPKECKDKVISMAGPVKVYGNSVLFSILVILVSFINVHA